MPPQPLTHTTTREITITLTGTFVPGRPAWGGSRFEPPINPPEPDAIEDLEVVALTIDVEDYDFTLRRRVTRTVNLLDNIDFNTAATLQFLDNLRAALEPTVLEDMFAEVEHD